jgi:lysophospholipase L1-like esterase
LAIPKPAGERRLLLLGDSVTWPDDGYPAILQRDLDEAGEHIDIVNAAVPGYTTHQERLHLEQLVDPVLPDVVVLQYCCNDNHRFLHHLTPDHWLITTEARRALLPEGDDLWTRFCRWSYVALEVRQHVLAVEQGPRGAFPWTNDAGFAPAWRDDGWTLVEAEVAAMHALLQSRGVPWLVMAVPYEPQLRDESLLRDRAFTCRPQARLAAICSSRSIPFLDLHPLFLAHRDELLFTDGIHLSPLGHRLVADELLAKLRAERLLLRR